MKLVSVKSVGLRGKSPNGGWLKEVKPEDPLHALVVVHADNGMSGIGSVFTDARLVEASLAVLRPLLIGESAAAPMSVSEKLHQHTFWMGRGGAITHSISGIDIALWDLFGKITGQSVSRLLGARYRDRVRAYASVLMDEPNKMRDVCARYRGEGFRAIKIGWGPFGRREDARQDVAIVKAAREGLGDDGFLMVDAGASDAFWPNGLNWAKNTSDMLRDHGVNWFEEPLRPDALTDFAELRRYSSVPIAGGECLTRRQSFMPWLEGRALDIVQPDVTKVGGISEQIQIARMADAFEIKYIGHGWNTAVGLGADLQLAAATPHTDFVEYIGGSAYVDDIVQKKWVLDENGMLAIPDAPGLGVDLDLDALAEVADGLDPWLST